MGNNHRNILPEQLEVGDIFIISAYSRLKLCKVTKVSKKGISYTYGLEPKGKYDFTHLATPEYHQYTGYMSKTEVRDIFLVHKDGK